jgi:gamma-glutamylcysteine synthetase
MADKLKQAKFEAKRIIDSSENFIVMNAKGQLLMLTNNQDKEQLQNYLVVLDEALNKIAKELK